MKILLATLFYLFIVGCSNDVHQKKDPKDNNQLEEKVEQESKDQVFIYQSDDMGIIEYLKCTKIDKKASNWVYYTEKNHKEIELGVMNYRGMEMIFFKNSPDVIYDILGSECGFTLEENDDISQWYEQISPDCDLN